MPPIKYYRADIFGGLSAAIVALPLALAFGVASGAGALAGLYGAILVGFFAAVFGGTPTQISGPTGPMTVIMATIIAHFSQNLALAFLVVSVAGLFQILFGLLGFGRYVKLVPQPVVSGFMTGIGVIVILLQFPPLLGLSAPPGNALVKLDAVIKSLPETNFDALMLGLATLAIVWFLPKRIDAYVPSTLVAIVAGSLLGMFLFRDIPTIGPIPSGLPQFQLPVIAITDIQYILKYALILAFLGSIDSLLTSLVADSITRTHHDSNKELVGQGIGNIAAGIAGGIPGAGATMRTMVNIRAGGHTRLSGMLHAVALLLIVAVFSDVASLVPLAVLAGILLKVGIDIIDWRYLKRVPTAPRDGVVIMLTTLFVTVFVDLMTAVAAGLVISSVLFVSRTAQVQMKSVKFAYGAGQGIDLSPEEETLLNEVNGRVVLFHVEGPLSFGSARDVARLMQSSVKKEVLIADFSDVPFIDSSASAALEEVIERLGESGDAVIFFGVRPAVKKFLQKSGVLALLGEDKMVVTRMDALRRAGEFVKHSRT